MPTDDPLFGGQVRIGGRNIHPMYLFEAKKPIKRKMGRIQTTCGPQSG
jgi:branched-chain amino acid transport system substrate-binding protein